MTINSFPFTHHCWLRGKGLNSGFSLTFYPWNHHRQSARCPLNYGVGVALVSHWRKAADGNYSPCWCLLSLVNWFNNGSKQRSDIWFGSDSTHTHHRQLKPRESPGLAHLQDKHNLSAWGVCMSGSFLFPQQVGGLLLLLPQSCKQMPS